MPAGHDRDGGLITAMVDYLISLKGSSLAGFASMSRDFTPSDADGNLTLPRLNLGSGANRIMYRTCQTTFRRLTIDFNIHAETETSLAGMGELLDIVLRGLAENPETISSLMPAGAGISEMEIVDQNTSHLRTNLWSRKVSTEWDISIVRP